MLVRPDRLSFSMIILGSDDMFNERLIRTAHAHIENLIFNAGSYSIYKPTYRPYQTVGLARETLLS